MKTTKTTVHPQKISTLQLWWLAIRPKTLPAAFAPILVGTAAAKAADSFQPAVALLCLLGSLLLQIGVNLANDYFDGKNQIDSDERRGPLRVTQSGLIAARYVQIGIVVSLSLAGLVFIILGSVGGWPIILVGIVSVTAALAYSGGPYPLASNGLGEIAVFLFFGLVAVIGTFYLQTGRVSAIACIAAFPPGLLITAVMVVNNFRDIETDSKAGKRTLAVLLGAQRTKKEYKILVWAGYFVPPLLFLLDMAGLPVFLPLLTLPLASSLSRKIDCDQSENLNTLLAETARFSLVYSLLFSAGLVCSL
ncbi:MAG: 1,4-dihydroxy-2-naphthoate polyprenyltransferase [Deltaproteobacteria bacterium]|nr:MAG: 1,4-dihydroxy-2-naphthoate polyprenyltransferase [Deltaproteobacteria bacterium]